MGNLPPGASGGLAPITTPLGEMFMFTIEGPLSLEEKRTLLDWTIRPALRTVAGVADVNSLGGEVRSFEIVPDPAALAARGLSLARCKPPSRANNRNDGAGRLSEGEETLLVRAEGAILTLDDVRAIVLKAQRRRGGAGRRRGRGAHRRSHPLRRGHPQRQRRGGEGLVLGLRGANAGEVVEGVKARLAELGPSCPPASSVQCPSTTAASWSDGPCTPSPKR
jgi:cobalt-zinc-cadmium resistance protein CzcA